MNIQLPEQVSLIIRVLNAAGHEAYAVGGCVRDSLLNRDPQDWDITTSALPEETKALFNRTIDTGIEHGTVTVMLGHEGYEVTTYRIDGKYSDSRHPDSVAFTRSLEEDLKRRDFTINAMAYCDDGLVDMFDGVGDLEKRVIRCVGDPLSRFSEDSLRILRAVRFSAQLDFDIDDGTMEAARTLAPKLSLISAERIHAELHKLLLSPNPDRLRYMHELGIDAVILPELIGVAESGRLDRCIELLTDAPADSYVRWALLLAFTGQAREIMRRLKFDNQTIHAVTELIRLSDAPMQGLTATDMRRLMNNAGAANMELLFTFRRAYTPDADYGEAYALYRSVADAGDATSIAGLAVSGRDLMELGIPAGKVIGETLDTLLSRVLENPALNTRETLMQLCREELNTQS